MIKILYVIANVSFGGGEKVFSQLAGRLNKDNYEIQFACSPGGHLECELSNLGIAVAPIDFKRTLNITTFIRLFKIMKSQKPDIVHSQGARANFYTRFAAKLAGVPFIVSTIAAPVEEFNVNPIKKAIYVLLNRCSEKLVDRFIVVADSLREKLIKRHRIAPEKIVRIYNGVELAQCDCNKSSSRLKEELNIEDNAVLVAAIGRLVWEKDLPCFIRAAEKVLSSQSQVKFLIVGDGPLRGSLENVVKTLGIERSVIFTGFREDIKEILSALDILVLCSLREGLPLTILEAMARAKPVVATNIEGVREEVIDNVTGILVEPRNSDSLEDAIICLLKDRQRAQALGLKGREIVEKKFTLEQAIELHEQLYHSLKQS